MRNPERIDRMVERLRALWHAHPDMRLGQLIVNLTCGGETHTFNQEDTLTERNIERVTEGEEFPRLWMAEP